MPTIELINFEESQQISDKKYSASSDKIIEEKETFQEARESLNKRCDILCLEDSEAVRGNPVLETGECQFVDSRSILRNKAKLKRFWEQKMELDLKERRRLAEANRKSKVVEQEANGFDENNNQVAGKRQSLSPTEPEELASKSSPAGSKQHQTISAGAICEKLLEYRAGNKSPIARGRRSIMATGEPREGEKPASLDQQQTTLNEAQLMSIDPTLCHPANQQTARQQDTQPYSSIAAAEYQPEMDEQCEEQTVNEEFNNSSSNSSFGPMSISVQTRNDERGPISDDDEGEESSAQSGSVLTVITNQQSEQNNQLLDDRLLLADDERDEGRTGSDIGVAFESLQFDSQIKSSKDEMVDSDLLLTKTQGNRENSSRFNARTVKSVCNFITAAISDATEQVENFRSAKTKEIEPETGAANVVRRATFVEESSERQNGNKSRPMKGAQVLRIPSAESPIETEEEVEVEAHVPKANLSSIFEANVRREIQRFESNGSRQRASKGQAEQFSKSGLTEWKIAEEIRLLNEREKELRQRKPARLSSESFGEPNSPAADTESIVRFGKTLRLPKYKAASNNNVAAASGEGQQPAQSKCIKLSTTANGSGNCNGSSQQSTTTTVSMHKFISSGGKKLVFTSTSSQAAGSNSSVATSNSSSVSGSQSSLHQPITKSMSNLSTTSRQADYKATDSLTSKETPNVKPGIAKQVIETFTRLSTSPQTPASDISRPVLVPTGEIASNLIRQHFMQHSSNFNNHQSASHSSGGSSNSSSCLSSAELKIQEELREMRAREAELRNRQQQRHQAETERSSSPKPVQAQSTEETARLAGQTNESIYPIKQTIESFKRLNLATNDSNKFASVNGQRHSSSVVASRRLKLQQAAREPPNDQRTGSNLDDYVSVG